MLYEIPGSSIQSSNPVNTGVLETPNDALENPILSQDARIAELTKALLNAQNELENAKLEFKDLKAEANEVFSELQGKNEELSSSNRHLLAELKGSKQRLTTYEVKDGLSKATIEQLRTQISGLSNRKSLQDRCALLKFQRDLSAGSLVGITLVAGAILAFMMGKAR